MQNVTYMKQPHNFRISYGLVNCLIKGVITMAAKLCSCYEYRCYCPTGIHSVDKETQNHEQNKWFPALVSGVQERVSTVRNSWPKRKTIGFIYTLSSAAGLIGIMPDDVTRASIGTSVELTGMMPSSRICTEYESATSKISKPLAWIIW